VRAYHILTHGGRMIYCFDIDGTICSSVNNSKYGDAVVFENMLNKINALHDEGNIIYFMTARGSVSGKDWSDFTKDQLNGWGFKYHKLIMNQKPHADYFIDDKGYNAKDWAKKNTKIVRGVIAGAFDVIHPGYIHTFEASQNHCDHLTVCLHTDPSVNGKMRPILSQEERIRILKSIKFVDEVIPYNTEKDLENLLRDNEYDVRILGSDYKNKSITGNNLCKKTVYIDRDHGWTTTKFKKLIHDNFGDL